MAVRWWSAHSTPSTPTPKLPPTTDGAVKSPMHGKLVAVLVAVGDMVTKGAKLAIVEAMKMEHALTAPFAGRVTEITAAPGAQVGQGAKLVVIDAG